VSSYASSYLANMPTYIAQDTETVIEKIMVTIRQAYIQTAAFEVPDAIAERY